ncbi:hypothetical protein BD289DRAFT_445172 [Coniella lustricola]|uniref:Uncharacterized protein n=1 Tax=Coniella lustricola TaxID=2025994 RepID=A0A2T2ZV63_9PEZI|nr:hypothetical protein BD289DRAFT_445172 [Coniella lustricola]
MHRPIPHSMSLLANKYIPPVACDLNSRKRTTGNESSKRLCPQHQRRRDSAEQCDVMRSLSLEARPTLSQFTPSVTTPASLPLQRRFEAKARLLRRLGSPYKQHFVSVHGCLKTSKAEEQNKHVSTYLGLTPDAGPGAKSQSNSGTRLSHLLVHHLVASKLGTRINKQKRKKKRMITSTVLSIALFSFRRVPELDVALGGDIAPFFMDEYAAAVFFSHDHRNRLHVSDPRSSFSFTTPSTPFFIGKLWGRHPMLGGLGGVLFVL